MPCLAVLRAAAQVRFAEDAALLDEHDGRGTEAGRAVDLEPAVGIEVARIFAVELQILAVCDEHRHLRTVLRGVEHLLGGEQRGIEIHVRSLEQRRFARGDIVLVNRGGSRVARHRIIDFGSLVVAVEARGGADARQCDIAHRPTVEAVLDDLALCILQIRGEEVSPGGGHILEQALFIFRNDCRYARRRVQVDLHQRIVRRVLVRYVIELVVTALDERVIGLEARQQRAEFRLGNFLIKYLGSRRTLRSGDEEPFAVLRGPCREVTQRMFGILINQLVSRLRRTEAVVIDFLELVLRREHSFFRSVVSAVIETFGIGSPLGAGELDPVDLIGRELAVGGVHHTNLHPVRAGFGHRAGAVFPVLGKSHRRKRHRPVVRERIGIEEHLALRTGGRRTVEHRLVLQPVVVEIVPRIAVFGRDALLGVIPQLGQPPADRVAERDLRQVILRHGILGLDPCRRRLRIVVFQPTVGIRDLRPEIVVHHVGALRLGVGHVFYLLHVVATCHHRRRPREGHGLACQFHHSIPEFG